MLVNNNIILNKLHCHTVHVGNASGVLLKTSISEFMYVFTAYHVIENDPNPSIIKEVYKNSHWVRLVVKKIEGRNILFDKIHDVAIILVENQPDMDFINTLENTNEHCVHCGYPKVRAEEAEIEFGDRAVVSFNSTIDNELIEYCYDQVIGKQELEAMSGGGIFLGLSILGIHHGCIADDKNEMLGRASMIPIRFYLDLLLHNKLPLILEFDLSNFDLTKDYSFKIDGDKQCMEDLSVILDIIRGLMDNMKCKSPLKIKETLIKDKQIGAAEVFENERDYWVQLQEYIIAMQILYDIEAGKTEICKMFSRTKYIYLNDKIDILDVRDKIDEKLLPTFNGDNKTVIIAGIIPSKYNGGVDKGDIPNVAKAKTSKVLDIALKDSCKENFDFINESIIVDALHHNYDKFAGHDKTKALEIYKQLLINKIFIKDERN